MDTLLATDVIGEIGCHLTWSELQKVSQDELEKSWLSIEKRQVDFAELPTYFCAMKNLQGYVHYSLNEHKKAEEKFDEVLSHDSNNISAVGNLAVLYKRQSRMRYFHECVEKLRNLLAVRNPVHLARAYADRAHAIRHFEQDLRCFTYSAFIKKAVDIGAETDSPEKAEWLFDYALALFRRDSQLVGGQAALTVTEPTFKEAVMYFATVADMTDAPTCYRALSWIFMGIMLRSKSSRSLGQALPDSLHLHPYTPMDCLRAGVVAHVRPSHRPAQGGFGTYLDEAVRTRGAALAEILGERTLLVRTSPPWSNVPRKIRKQTFDFIL